MNKSITVIAVMFIYFLTLFLLLVLPLNSCKSVQSKTLPSTTTENHSLLSPQSQNQNTQNNQNTQGKDDKAHGKRKVKMNDSRGHGNVEEENIFDMCNIPKVIYRTYSSHKMSQRMKKLCHDKWIKLNPEFTMIWYDNQQVDDFMTTQTPRIQRAYQSLVPGAFKADLWRLCVLLENGGMYVDSFSVPFVPIRKWIRPSDLKPVFVRQQEHTFISVRDMQKEAVHQGLIICSAGHPFLQRTIDNICQHVEQKYYGENSLHVTGPVCMFKSMTDELKEKEQSVEFVPQIKSRHKKQYIGHNFKVGWNVTSNQFGQVSLQSNHQRQDLSFYLFDFQGSKRQVIIDHGRVLMKKKFSNLLEFFRKKIKNNSYPQLWKERKIYQSPDTSKHQTSRQHGANI